MIWIATVLGLFLFYYFVERKHKVIFFKIAAILLVLGGIVIGGFFYYKNYQSYQRATWLTAKYTFKDIKADPIQKSKWVDQIWQSKEQIDEISLRYPNISSTDRELLKQGFFGAYLPDKSGETKWETISDEEFAAMIAGGIEWDNFCRKNKLEKHLSTLSAARKENKELPLSTVIPLSAALKECDIPEFFNAVLPQEHALVKLFEGMREDALERLYIPINAAPFDTQISFSVCNNRDVPLKSYSFNVSGFQKGRSTPKPITRSDSYGTYTRLESDIIIEGKKCSTITYSVFQKS
ncbi:MAG: hypothetical protein IT292_01035 [Deltaproteobacteria bacterium]|nr:hypothetical protein [Deltaproteobacteria bacterium]